MRKLLWGKRSCRGGLGAQAADRTYRGLRWPVLRHRREAKSQRIFRRRLAPWAAGSWDSWTHINPACPPSPTAKGTRAPFSPSSGKERSGSCFCVQAPSSPAAQETKHLPAGLHLAKGKRGHRSPSPGSWSTPLLGCFLASHALGSTASDTERGARRREPAQPVFPLHSQGISFVLSRVWHIPAQSSSRSAGPCRASRGTAGTGAVLARAVCPRHRQLQGQGSGHKDLKGWAMLRGVWQNTVHVQSNAGYDRRD